MKTGEDRIDLQPRRIISCALTVLHALGSSPLKQSMKICCCANAGTLDLRYRNTIALTFATMELWSGNKTTLRVERIVPNLQGTAAFA